MSLGLVILYYSYFELKKIKSNIQVHKLVFLADLGVYAQFRYKFPLQMLIHVANLAYENDFS